MSLGDLCICGHTREVHFGHACSVISSLTGRACPCRQFVECGQAVEIFQVLKKLAAHPSACPECRQMIAIARQAIAAAEES